MRACAVILLLALTGCGNEYACRPTGDIGVRPGGYVLPYGGMVKTMKTVERYECSDGKDRWMTPQGKD